MVKFYFLAMNSGMKEVHDFHSYKYLPLNTRAWSSSSTLPKLKQKENRSRARSSSTAKQRSSHDTIVRLRHIKVMSWEEGRISYRGQGFSKLLIGVESSLEVKIPTKTNTWFKAQWWPFNCWDREKLEKGGQRNLLVTGWWLRLEQHPFHNIITEWWPVLVDLRRGLPEMTSCLLCSPPREEITSVQVSRAWWNQCMCSCVRICYKTGSCNGLSTNSVSRSGYQSWWGQYRTTRITLSLKDVITQLIILQTMQMDGRFTGLQEPTDVRRHPPFKP